MPRAYPHISQIEDHNTQAAIRLLWDQLHSCEAALIRMTTKKNALERQLASIPKLTRQMIRLESLTRG